MKKTLLKAITLTGLCLSPATRAHDGGHGPKLTDSPKMGGVLASVIDHKDEKLGAKAAVLYKAELVRTGDGLVRVYFFDAKMNPAALGSFAKTAKASLHHKKAKVPVAFDLTLKGEAFEGKLPPPPGKPYHLEVETTEGTRKLLTEFKYLD